MDRLDRESLISRGFGWLLESTFLGQLTENEQNLALSLMRWSAHESGTHLTTCGQVCRSVYLVVSGMVVITRPGERGAQDVTRVGPGNMVGEGSAVSGVPAAMDAVAASRVMTLEISSNSLNILRANIPRFAQFLNDILGLRSRWDFLVRILSRNSFLRVMGKEDIERLLQVSSIVNFAKGETFVTAGALDTEVFVLLKGRVSISAPLNSGCCGLRMAYAEPGELLGHAAILLELPRTADLTAAEDVELLQIPGPAFVDLLQKNPLVQRHLLQYLATLDLHTAAPRRLPGQMMTFVTGRDRKLGATTIAYGMAACLSLEFPTILVDLDGEKTAEVLGFPVHEEVVGGARLKVMGLPEGWDIKVCWPGRNTRLETLLDALRDAASERIPATAPILLSGRPDSPHGKDALRLADAVLFVRRSGDSICELDLSRGQLLFQAIRLEKGVALPLATSRRSARVPDDPVTVERFWSRGDLSLFIEERNNSVMARVCARLVRLVRGRSIGVALGGGGALGFAHVGLLEVLRSELKMPIDVVAGVSFGSLVGALYVGGGLEAVRKLVEDRWLLTGLVGASLASTRPLRRYVDYATAGMHLGESEIPFYPVGLDLISGREHTVHNGTFGLAVLSASCLPGVFPAMQRSGLRLVDGGLVNNVPASTVWEAGADFIISSNIIPSNPEGRTEPLGNRLLGKTLLWPLARIDDVLRSLYMFTSQNGRDRSTMADFVFDLDVSGFNIYDFPRGREIMDCGRDLAMSKVEMIMDTYAQDSSMRF